MSDENGGTKGNKGDFVFTSSVPKPRRKRRSRNANDGGAKVIVALLIGAGAAFLLALAMLISRLESEEASNGLLNSGVGGARGVDDVYMEEMAQGMPMLRKDRQRERQNKLVERMVEEEMAMHHKGKNGREENRKEKREEKRKEKRAKREGREEKKAKRNEETGGGEGGIDRVSQKDGAGIDGNDKSPHLYPRFPPMPPHTMAVDLFGEKIITDTLSHDKPTVAGIIAILQRFLQKLHLMLVENKHAKTPNEVIEKYFVLVNEYLEPFEKAYRDRPIFPVREDESIFMSLGAYRDHLLGETLRQAFKTAANPEKLFVGAVVQNCFGIDVQCRTGVEVKGKDKKGRPLTQVSDRPPDVNGIEQFCGDPGYSKYCESGQVRVLYVNETESNGPTTARYFASKLWGGETYFLQADAHLRFAQDWDRLYAKEVKAAGSYPKAVLSSYPPGFSEGEPPFQGGSRGTRLCTCEFSTSNVEFRILRINVGGICGKEGDPPTQIAYIAAGFFFVRAEFLVDVPFDPFLPWCFMGEEIALSLRAWTHGWDIYAPRKNLIAHQYRPGRMGLPKFWENTGRVFGRPGPDFNTKLQSVILQRIKYMVGYKESTKEKLEEEGKQIVLTDFEHYGPGDVRALSAFLEHVKIDMENEECGHIEWCNKCTLK